jgi:hypothetical protein
MHAASGRVVFVLLTFLAHHAVTAGTGAAQVSHNDSRALKVITARLAASQAVFEGTVVSIQNVVAPDPDCLRRTASFGPVDIVTIAVGYIYSGDLPDTVATYGTQDCCTPIKVGDRVLAYGNYYSSAGWRLWAQWIHTNSLRDFFYLPMAQVEARRAGVRGKIHITTDEIRPSLHAQLSVADKTFAASTTTYGLFLVTSAEDRVAIGPERCEIAVIRWLGEERDAPTAATFNIGGNCWFTAQTGDTLLLPITGKPGKPRIVDGCPSRFLVACGFVPSMNQTLASIEESLARDKSLRLWGARKGETDK